MEQMPCRRKRHNTTGRHQVPSNLKYAMRGNPDYFIMLAAAVILLGISIIAGIIYTYGFHRQLAAGEYSDGFHRQLAADDYSVIILAELM
jgi:hypothetical protein